jgi:tetratricopeptide (TPR) repeat protein
LEIEPNNKYVLDSKGYTLINLDKYEEAIEYFNKALSIDPEYVDALNHKKIAEEKLRNRNK